MLSTHDRSSDRIVWFCRVFATLAVASVVTSCGGHRSDPSGRTELRSYFHRVTEEQQRYEQIQAGATGALHHASADAPDLSWDEAANRLKTAVRGYDTLIGRMVSIRAPASLAPGHAGLVESLRLYQRLLTNLEGPLAAHDVDAMARTLPETTKLGIRASELRIRWRVAAKSRANRLGLLFPSALDNVGRQRVKSSVPLSA